MTQLDEYLGSVDARTEMTDGAFIRSLTEYEYQQNINEIAKKLNLGKRYLNKWRPPEPNEEREKQDQGRSLSICDIEPWVTPVDGNELFLRIEKTIHTYLIAPEPTSRILALWAAMTYLVSELEVLPMLVFTSPVKRSGKTTALELTRRLANRAIMASSITPSAIFRIVEECTPTLLLDEADSIFKTNDDLRTLINASFTRNSAIVYRVQGNNFEPRSFSSFCPKALALIGQLPDTIADRSIVVPMRRKKVEEKTERLRADSDLGFSELRSMLTRWVRDNHEKILSQDPEIPPRLNDRQADCWRELLKVADTIGSHWSEQIRADAISICENTEDDGDAKIMLLEDIQSFFFSEKDMKQAPSHAIVNYLIELEGRPWAEWKVGKPITTNTLANMLRTFSIRPKTIRVGYNTMKGYVFDAFTEVFSRYLSDRNAVAEADNSMSINAIESSENVTVAESKCNTEEDPVACQSGNWVQQNMSEAAKIREKMKEIIVQGDATT